MTKDLAGHQVGFHVGSVNAYGLRGGLALRNFKQGEAVTSIPVSAGINVGPAHYTAAVCACNSSSCKRSPFPP